MDSHVQIAELFVPGLELPLRSHSWYLTTTRGILVRDGAVYYRKSNTSMEKLTAFIYKIVKIYFRTLPVLNYVSELTET